MEIDPSICLGPFETGDAEGLVSAFRSVYGQEYPVDMVYDPAYWVNENAGEGLFTYVSRTSQGQVTGLVSFFRTSPFGGLYEFGQLAVLPEFRRGDLGGKLLAYAMKAFAEEPTAAGAFTEVGCHWTVSQRMQSVLGYQETALAVDLLGAETYAKEHAVSQRISALVTFYSFRDRPHTIYLPPAWEALLGWIYEGVQGKRTFARSAAQPEGASQLASTYLEGPQLLRIDVSRPGADLSARLLELESGHEGAPVVQLRLPLEDPTTPAAIEALARRGYRCCGVLPRWFDGDGLLLQRNRQPADFSGNKIHTPRGKELEQRIQAHWTDGE